MLRTLNIRVATRLGCLLPSASMLRAAPLSRRCYSGSASSAGGDGSNNSSNKTSSDAAHDGHHDAKGSRGVSGNDDDDDHAMDFFDDDLWFLDELMGESASDMSTFIPEKDAKLIEREQQ